VNKQKSESLEAKKLPISEDARVALINSADGDGRFLLNQAETLFSIKIENPLDPKAMAALLHRRMPVYDKNADGHYNLISALHKSVRGSDPDAALYWFARMLEGGEDPRFLLIQRHCSNAWPQKTPMNFWVALKANWQ